MVKILKTSMTFYLSGPFALNIPMPDYATGDWHMIETFFKGDENKKVTFLAGEGREVNTFHFFGNCGISDRTKDAERYGIPIVIPLFCANHFRAVCDMVIKSVLNGRCGEYIRLDDYMPDDNDKEPVIKMLSDVDSFLTADQNKRLLTWLEKNKI